jgi:uncharacterized membrane protein YfcA
MSGDFRIHKGEILDVQALLTEHWLVISVAALCIGFDKGGMKPMAILATFFLTTAFTPRFTLAVTVPIMFTGDIFPIIRYRKHIHTQSILKILPWAGGGIALGALIGPFINDETFKTIIGILILFMATLIVLHENGRIHYSSMQKPVVVGGLGIMLGFASIIGNAAGSIASIYFVGQKLDKYGFIGTNATLSAANNLVKIFVFVFIWRIVTPATALISLAMVPIILLGILLSTIFITLIPERAYRIVIICSIIYSGFALIF